MSYTKISLLVTAGALAAFGACTPTPGDDCKEFSTCSPSGDGDGDGDTGGSGDGDGDTGGSGDGDTGGNGGDTSGGTGGTVDPCDACDGATPLCDDNDECVECLSAGDCFADEPVCSAGACDSCVQNSDCSEHGDAVCDTDTGACVECLTEAECSSGTKVCDRETNTCTDLDAGAEFACEACEYNEQCAPGHVCVEMTYSNPMEGVVGRFCLWERDAGLPGPNGSCGIAIQPYAQEAAVTTVSGESTTVCRPATTTCVAILQHRTTVDGCETEFVDDAACGADGFNDGRCRLNGSMEPKCSYVCGGTEDCPGGFTCPAAGDKFCSL